MTFATRLMLITAALLSHACIIYAPANLGFPRPPSLSELEVEDSKGSFVSEKIVIIPINGTISSQWQGSLFAPARNQVADFVAQLDLAREDEDVRAVVLRINSPGGSVTASDQIHREILAFKKATGIPVIAAFMDTAASGGYYVAMAADEVIAHPTTITGSIGVIMEITNVEGMFDLIGLQQTVFKTGAYKDMGSSTRPITPEEQDLFQGIIDDMYQQFVDVVDQGRPELDRAAVEKLADGRVYTARQALDNGLVDRIGYLDDALERARLAAGITDAHVISYRLGWWPAANIYGTATPMPSPEAAAPGSFEGVLQTALEQIVPEPGARFLYLWQPGG
jgi:protease-4